jgi:hypothetical protein
MNNLQLMGSILVDPRPAFVALNESPRFWVAIWTPVLLQAAILLWYFAVVDYAWLAEELWATDPGMRGLSTDQRLEALPSHNAAMWSTILLIVLGWFAVRVAEAVCFSFAGRMLGARKTFRHWLALTAWSSFPHVLAVLAMAIPLVIHRASNTTLEGLSLLSLNELVFHGPRGSRWHTLLSSLTVLQPWLWWLTVAGFRALSGRSWGSSVLFGLAPTAAVYALWVLYTFL